MLELHRVSKVYGQGTSARRSSRYARAAHRAEEGRLVVPAAAPRPLRGITTTIALRLWSLPVWPLPGTGELWTAGQLA